MSNPTLLNCSRTTAMITFLLIGSLFCLTGCAQLYKLLGFTEEQTQQQLSEDRETIIRTITQVRTTTAEIITTAIAALGTIATGFLAKWLSTERKITKVLIAGVEKTSSDSLKETIHKLATDAGIEPKLNSRVNAQT